MNCNHPAKESTCLGGAQEELCSGWRVCGDSLKIVMPQEKYAVLLLAYECKV